MKVAVIAYTNKGLKLAEKISRISDLTFRNESLCFCVAKNGFDASLFIENDGIIFISAIGIAVRKIAPYVESKLTDPAVIVIDENAEHVIPILSGHIGGANEIAKLLAKKLNSRAVITTATDVNGYKAIDEIIADNGLIIKNRSAIKNVNSKILKGEKIGIYCDGSLEPTFEINGIYGRADKHEADVIICAENYYAKEAYSIDDFHLFVSHKRIVLGIGCRRGISKESLERAIEHALCEARVDISDVEIIATIDIKKDEKALVDFAMENDITLKTYTSTELNLIDGDFDESDFVKSITGVSNVSERAAVAAGTGGVIGEITKGTGDAFETDKATKGTGDFLVKRIAMDGVTVSVFEKIKRIEFNGKA